MNDRFPDKPKSIKIKQSNNEITIITKWFNFNFYTLCNTGFTLVWCSISFPIFFLILLNVEEGIVFSPFTIFTIPFVIAGICLLYYTIASWINRTYIFANEDAIIIRHKPIPWRGNTNFRVVKLDKLYSKKNKSGNNEQIYFELHAKANNGADKKLLKVKQSEEALFIEKTLKNYFNLEDEPIEGELSSEV